MKIRIDIQGTKEAIEKKAKCLESDGWKRKGKIKKQWFDCYEDSVRAANKDKYLYLVLEKEYSD